MVRRTAQRQIRQLHLERCLQRREIQKRWQPDLSRLVQWTAQRQMKRTWMGRCLEAWKIQKHQRQQSDLLKVAHWKSQRQLPLPRWDSCSPTLLRQGHCMCLERLSPLYLPELARMQKSLLMMAPPRPEPGQQTLLKRIQGQIQTQMPLQQWMHCWGQRLCQALQLWAGWQNFL